MKKIAILIIVGIALVLSATLLYISNGLVVSKARKVTNMVSGEVKEGGLIPSGKQDETSLDAVFGGEELVDNFDDIVQ
ncbi:MAG: hypothetical protein WC988_00800 [Patescibacteria group bacterium]